MPVGKCGLCGENEELRDSHLLPKSVYKKLRKAIELDRQKNPNPVVVNDEVTIASSQQVADHFLCGACEHRFSTLGEKWVVENCWQANNTFPLRDALQAAKPVHVGKDEVRFFEGATISGVDVQKIVYFAASVFWRAGAHDFGEVLGSKPQRLALGPCEDELRAFLLGNGAFPPHAALLVTVSGEPDERANELALFPFLRNQKSGSTEYAFAIPGVAFQLFVGERLDGGLVALSVATAPTHFIILGSFDGVLEDMWKLISKSKKMLI